MKSFFKDKTYLIVGGTKVIGLALTHPLLAAGANVHVYSRTLGDLPPSERLVHHVCDFATADFESAELPETVHGVAYCPGTINLRSFRSLKLAGFQNDFAIDVLDAIRFLKGCMAGLKKKANEHPTSVVLFSTVAAGTGLPMHASIAAAKGAFEGLTRTLAALWAPKTRVNCLAPALTDTPLAANFFSTEEKRAAMDAKYPLDRAGTSTDLANMATFLLSLESGWITGQVTGGDVGMSGIHG